MRRVFLSLLAMAVAVPLLASDSKPAKLLKAKGPRAGDSYIVVMGDREENVGVQAADLVRHHHGRLNHVFTHTIKGFSANLSEHAAMALSRNPKVAYVEEDAIVTAKATQSGATWGIDRIDQRDLPVSGAYTYSYTGSGVKAYILDTGINVAHNEFGGRAINGYDAVDGSLPAADCNGHGTHVAGTVGGATYGVAKGVTLVAVRVLDCTGSGTSSGVIAGIDWVTADHASGAPAVANLSLGGGASTALDDAVSRSINDGVTYAVAAGDENINACNRSPSRVAAALTVGSTASTDARSSFSNYGPCVDLFAPGSSITSAWYLSNTSTNTISGTSMATPHVCGVAALYLSQNGYQTPSTVAAAIIGNSTPNKVTNPGTGSPNRLLYSLWGGGTPAPTISSFSPAFGGVGAIVTINGSNFTEASSVRFNGQSASFSVLSSSQITATVPNCSSTGALSVTTAGGTATSSGSFAVTGCGDGPSQLLGNPGFESGATLWTESADTIDASPGRPARTGSWKAWLCGYGSVRTDYVSQTVTIPSNATSATLSFWIRIDSAETTTTTVYDRFSVRVSTNEGSTYTTAATYSNLNKNSTYVQKSFDLLAYRGLSVQIRLEATEDSSLQTSFVVDDIAVNVQ